VKKHLALITVGVLTVLLSGCGYEAISMKTEAERKGYRMDFNPRVRGWSTPASLTWYCVGAGSYCTEVGYAMSEWNNETVMNLSKVSNYDSSRTNILYAVGNYGDTGYSGLSYAGTRGGNTEWSTSGCIRKYGCRLASARTNLYYDFVRNSSSARRGIACQEVGHLFGVGHSPGDCMGYTYFSDANAYISPHSVDGVALLRYIEAVYGV
jgi:hypothetical protein